MTRAPRTGRTHPGGRWSPNASVPYSASYNDPQRALAALSAYRAFVTGTTSCGPAIVVISGSALSVLISKEGPAGTR